MNRQEITAYIKANPQEHLQRDKSGKGYICPLCGNGKGESGTGLRTKDNGQHWKCFKCGFYGDMIDLIAKEYDIPGGSKEAFDKARELYRLDITDNAPYTHSTYNKQHTEKKPKGDSNRMSNDYNDYRDYLETCIKNLEKTDYLERRGISRETIAGKYAVGYDPNFKGIGGEWKALIIATSTGSFIARNTDETADKDHRYKNTGSVGIFNKKALGQESPLFVVEGAIDALSIIEAGGQAIALNSTANVGALLREIEENPPKASPLLLAMDKDEAGQKALEALREGLNRLNIAFKTVDITGGYKDANEALKADRELFIEYVKDADKLPTDKERYLDNTGLAHLSDFIDGIKDSVNTPFVSTGFKELDKQLGGGLTEGLYFVGAISSLGKTTFVLQIADQIAEAGNDVLIISLEMARAELMAKSISRLTMLNQLEKGNGSSLAKTQLGITAGERYSNYSKEEITVINEAIKAYKRFAGNIAYIEGVGDITATEVREFVRKHIFFTGKKPIVIIDYLQILAPMSEKATDKQNTDKSVTELKRISRDYKIPIIGISSFNRDNYNEPVNMSSFKESGAIEYSSDVLIGLQYSGMDYSEGESSDKRAKRVRELYKMELERGKNGQAQSIELKVLKNRKGGRGASIKYSYYPMFNLFRELDNTINL